MSAVQVSCTIKGETPLICNRYTENAEASNGTSPGIKTKKQMTPRQQAEVKLYKTKEGVIYWPVSNLFAAIIAAGRYIKAGKRNLTTAAESVVPAFVSLVGEIAVFEPQEWEVDSRPVVIPSTGGRIMCHRPRFDAWQLSFEAIVQEELHTDVFRQLVDYSCSRCGFGDFRPQRKGPYGRGYVVQWKEEPWKEEVRQAA